MHDIPQEFQIQDRSFTCEQIHSVFHELLTPKRKQLIANVVKGRRLGTTLVLEKLYDLGNISAIIRSAENLGYLNLHIIESAQTKYSSRTTQGAHKWVNRHTWSQTTDCLHDLKRRGHQIVATALTKDSVPIQQIDFSKPTALIVGNEKDGVSEEALALADFNCTIPTTGFSQSFNVSIAAAILMSYVFFERGSKFPDLTPEQQRALEADYYLRTYTSHHKLYQSLTS